VGHVHGSEAQFLLNQGVSAFALWDFPITFQDTFFGIQIKKILSPLHTAYWQKGRIIYIS